MFDTLSIKQKLALFFVGILALGLIGINVFMFSYMETRKSKRDFGFKSSKENTNPHNIHTTISYNTPQEHCNQNQGNFENAKFPSLT